MREGAGERGPTIEEDTGQYTYSMQCIKQATTRSLATVSCNDLEQKHRRILNSSDSNIGTPTPVWPGSDVGNDMMVGLWHV